MQKNPIRQQIIKYAFYFLLVVIIYFVSKFFYGYYQPPELHKKYVIHHSHDTLSIAYIGDSWAYYHQKHNCEIVSVLEDMLHCPIKISSFGLCGYTSKEIYESMYINSDFRNFLQEKALSCCIIFAGINDTYKKMSTEYYKISMQGIIELLLANHIVPIIIEIPDYDIIKAYESQTIEKKLLRQLSTIINNTEIDCKKKFRHSFNDLITEENYLTKICIIRYKSWNNNYKKDIETLYLADGMHLNEKGYAKLDSEIVRNIIYIYNHSKATLYN